MSAFSVFIAVYCQKFKDAAPGLIKYMNTIRNMFKQKEDWYQYDIEFRRSKLQLQISWGNMHHHLWLTHMLANRQDNVQPITGSTNTSNLQGYNSTQNLHSAPFGYCVRYHESKFCYLPCIYNHRCFICNLTHPASKCWHQQGNTCQIGGQLSHRFNNVRSNNVRALRGTQQPARLRGPSSKFRSFQPPIRYTNPRSIFKR